MGSEVTSVVEADLKPATVSPWKWPVLIVASAWLFLLFSMHRTTAAMIETWYHSRTYSHCFLIFPLFALLVWMRRRRLLAVLPAPTFWSLPVLVGLGFLWLLGNLGEARVLEEFALVGMLVALVWAVLGPAVVRILAFPLAFLFFAVPFGQSLIGPLQDFTAYFAVHALTLSGVPAVLDGRTISLPTATWAVAEACSGIRYLFSSLVVGTIYAALVYRSRLRRMMFVLASILVPIVANGIRAYGIILLAYVSNNRIAVDVDHIVYGGVFFLLVQVGLLTAGLRWREKPEVRSSAALVPRESPGKNIWKMAALAISIVAGAGILEPVADRLWNRAELASQGLDLSISVASPWQKVNAYDTGWTPNLRDPDQQLRESYRLDERRVDLYSVLYSGRTGMELINGYNRFENSKMWVLTTADHVPATLNGSRFTVERSLIDSSTASRSLWSWYWAGGKYTDSATRVKLLQAKARLLGEPAAAAVIVVGVENEEGAAADRILQDFLSHVTFLPSSASLPAVSSAHPD